MFVAYVKSVHVALSVFPNCCIWYKTRATEIVPEYIHSVILFTECAYFIVRWRLLLSRNFFEVHAWLFAYLLLMILSQHERPLTLFATMKQLQTMHELDLIKKTKHMEIACSRVGLNVETFLHNIRCIRERLFLIFLSHHIFIYLVHFSTLNWTCPRNIKNESSFVWNYLISYIQLEQCVHEKEIKSRMWTDFATESTTTFYIVLTARPCQNKFNSCRVNYSTEN